MTIYKIRYFVNKKKRNGDLEPYEYKEDIVIDNIDYAKDIYKKFLNECQYIAQYSSYSGKCELFIPHQLENGLLVCWPNNEEYIKQFEF